MMAREHLEFIHSQHLAREPWGSAGPAITATA